MSEIVYKDYIPANSRVIIDYKKDEKVRFSYPLEYTYEQAVKKFVGPTTYSWWMAINLLLFFYTMFAGMIIIFILFLFLQLKNPVLVERIVFMTNNTKTLVPDIWIPFFILYFFLPPYLIKKYLVHDKERLSRWFPVLGYQASKMLTGTKGMVFTTNDIINNRAIIPIFSNVFLEYNALEDFGKYLDKVEILEIPFFYIKNKSLWPWNKKNKKVKNEYVFRAVFFFSQTPKTGSLEVEFI